DRAHAARQGGGRNARGIPQARRDRQGELPGVEGAQRHDHTQRDAGLKDMTAPGSIVIKGSGHWLIPDDALTASPTNGAPLAGELRAGFSWTDVAYLISTIPTLLTRLLAVTTLPSRVTSTLRTMSPPPGIAQVWNFSVLGSKRTIVF